MECEITLADNQAKAMIVAMMVPYIAELEGVDNKLAQDGFSPDKYFDAYWIEPERHPFLITSKDVVVGFCFVRALGDQFHAIAEFYIQHPARRNGIGKMAAQQIFALFPGEWQVAQMANNTGAQAFWRAVISEVTGDQFDEGWSHSQPIGPMQKFRVTG